MSSITARINSAGTDAPTPGRWAAVGGRLLSAYFLTIGLAAIGLLAAAAASDAGIQSALGLVETADGEPRPSLILAFLVNFGIVLPVLILIIGGIFIALGIRLWRRQRSAARWASIALIWLIVGAVFLGALNLIDEVQRIGQLRDAAFTLSSLSVLLLPAVVLVSALAALLWLGRNLESAYQGAVNLNDDTTRLAWSLLIPTLAVVILVAARPLEQTFIRSLTDKRFASQEVPQFVGLDNYARLLGIRLDLVECRRDDPTAPCALRPNGEIRWQSIPSDLLQAGYRTAWNIYLPTLLGPDRSLAISSRDADFLKGVATTLVFTVTSVSLELVIALFMALTVNSNFAGRGIMRAIMLIPWAIPTVISARLWELMLKDTSAGIINRVMLDFGLISQPQAWLSEPSLQLPAAIMVDVWKTSPFMALLLLAGLQLIPSDLYEAADVDGASRLRQLFAITLPLLRPTIVVALVFRTLDALRVFDLFNVLFGRQQLSMATYNYEMLVNNQQDGYASAVSVMIFLLIFIFAVAYVRFLKVETN
ncbi:MAG: carbohydrate ABC transporter permease [Candidatus Flexifilum sp.]